jgi:hypothetical protein
MKKVIRKRIKNRRTFKAYMKNDKMKYNHYYNNSEQRLQMRCDEYYQDLFLDKVDRILLSRMGGGK